MPRSKYHELVHHEMDAQDFEDMLGELADAAARSHADEAENADWAGVARLLRAAKKKVAARTGN